MRSFGPSPYAVSVIGPRGLNTPKTEPQRDSLDLESLPPPPPELAVPPSEPTDSSPELFVPPYQSPLFRKLRKSEAGFSFRPQSETFDSSSDDAFTAMQEDIVLLKQRVDILERQSYHSHDMRKVHAEIQATADNECVREAGPWDFHVAMKKDHDKFCFELHHPAEQKVAIESKCSNKTGDFLAVTVGNENVKEKKDVHKAKEHFKTLDPLHHLSVKEIAEVKSLFPIPKGDHHRCAALFDFMAIRPPRGVAKGYDWIRDYYFERAQDGGDLIAGWNARHGTLRRRKSTLRRKPSQVGKRTEQICSLAEVVGHLAMAMTKGNH
ncbi:hypothetical protein FOZ61_005791 [Perkinsus olseni]|uniref:Uncharacterized protein n=1 Tax=Perkinsus olseni TaxID=32597 RepID=A0A7J6MB71_PEROL|nr:hypothetical protein FOZ61_005791 [Perkinsus olseni]